jgi:hypothetical protein
MIVIAAVSRHERDRDVGVAPLRADEGLGVALAAVELLQHLVGRIAAARAVALHLPFPAQILGRIEEHSNVVGISHRRGVKAEQPLDDREARRANVLGRSERAVLVAVDRLDDRLAAAQMDEMLLQDVEVVAVGVKRREPALAALLAVKAVVVIGRDVGDLLLAEDPDQPARQRCLAGGGVTHDAEEDRGEASGGDRIATVNRSPDLFALANVGHGCDAGGEHRHAGRAQSGGGEGDVDHGRGTLRANPRAIHKEMPRSQRPASIPAAGSLGHHAALASPRMPSADLGTYVRHSPALDSPRMPSADLGTYVRHNPALDSRRLPSADLETYARHNPALASRRTPSADPETYVGHTPGPRARPRRRRRAPRW